MAYQLITFDVYTALADIESSLEPLVARYVTPPHSLHIVQMWRRKQLEYVLISNSLSQGRVSFRLITRRALDYTLAHAQLELTEVERESLVEAWNWLRLWPDAGKVLSAVKACGYEVGLLSNGDDAMLHAFSAQLPIACDIFSSERAGKYKPHAAVYALPVAKLGLRSDDILHVAGSPTDVMGAKAAGLRVAWSNRLGERVLAPELAPDYEFGNLSGVLEVL